MPVIPSPDQVIPKVLIKEAVSSPKKGTPEAVAEAIAQKADSGKWRDGLTEAIRSPIDQGRISQKIEQIGIERDPATGAKKRSPQEETRYREAEGRAALAKKFFEEGYGNMNFGEQLELRAQIEEAVKFRPQLAQEMNAMGDKRTNPGLKKASFERILNDPRYIAQAREIINALLDPEKKLIDEAKVTEAEDRVSEQEIERDNKQLELNDVSRRLAAVDRQLAEFARPQGASPGLKATDIDRIKNNLSTIQAELVTYQTLTDNVQFRLAQLQQEREAVLRGYNGRPLTDIDAEINTERNNLKNAQQSFERRQADIQKLPELEQEQREAEQQKLTLEKERRDRQLEFSRLDFELQKRMRNLADIKAIRESEEQDLVDGFGSLFEDAADRYIGEQIEDAVGKFDEEIERLKKQTEDDQEKAMYDALRERWLGKERTRMKGFPGFRRKDKYRPIDRTQVAADFDLLMKGGPEAVARELLMSRTNPDTNNNYTDDETKAILVNKDYLAKVQPEIVRQLLGRRMLTGGISPEDIHVIVNAPWGEGMIDEALKKNEEFRQAVEKVMGAGSVSGPGYLERLGQEIRRKPWLLAILLGFVILPLKAIKTSAAKLDIGI
ncbi:hypothetical protein M1615_04665 [Patescibacteria group bacterium]|nr:hypothetical protein [Patescibacteria group bacterium]MCL5010197.1 hypothetical protein [Patescibacteria group bacterium]